MLDISYLLESVIDFIVSIVEGIYYMIERLIKNIYLLYLNTIYYWTERDYDRKIIIDNDSMDVDEIYDSRYNLIEYESIINRNCIIFTDNLMKIKLIDEVFDEDMIYEFNEQIYHEICIQNINNMLCNIIIYDYESDMEYYVYRMIEIINLQLGKNNRKERLKIIYNNNDHSITIRIMYIDVSDKMEELYVVSTYDTNLQKIVEYYLLKYDFGSFNKIMNYNSLDISVVSEYINSKKERYIKILGHDYFLNKIKSNTLYNIFQ
jgi:hypothetical protein